MLTLVRTTQFIKDYKLIKKRGYDLSKLAEVIDCLLAERPLDQKYLDHELTGQYKGFKECHIEPDWLLIYTTNNRELILTVTRTGTHSDLF